MDAGVDAIVAQGTEAGGHGGARATLPFVPAVVDIAGKTPVIAAGGIADGRVLAAVLALGASGVLCGTGFFACNESLASENAKQAVLNGSGDDPERSSVFDIARGLNWLEGWSLWTMPTAFTRLWSVDMDGFMQNLAAEKERFKAAQIADDTDVAAVIFGEVADLIVSREPARDTLHRTVLQVERWLRHVGQLVCPAAKDLCDADT